MIFTFPLPNSTNHQIYPDDDHYFSHALLCWSADLTWWRPFIFSCLTMLINRSILLMTSTFLLPNYAMINRSILMMTISFLLPNSADQQIYPDDDNYFLHVLLCWSTDLSWWWPLLFSCLTLLVNRSILLMTRTFLFLNSADQQIYPEWWPELFSFPTLLVNRSILMMISTFLMPNYTDQQIYPDDD